MIQRFQCAVCLAVSLAAFAGLIESKALADSTHYTYQGRLAQNGSAVSGLYDLRFRVFPTLNSDVPISTTYADDHPINDGLFTARIEITPIYSVGPRWIEVSVRPGSISNSDRSDASYTKLNPRQELTPTPYAILAYKAAGLSLPIDEAQNALFTSFKIKNDSGGAVMGESVSSVGVAAKSASGIALYAVADAGGMAGVFQGPVSVSQRVSINYGNATSINLVCNGSAAKPGGGSWTVLSDERAKQNIRPLRGALERVLQLQGFTFEYTPAALQSGLALAGLQIGLVAQQVERVFPEWVEQDDDGTKLVTERGTTALFVEALRELRAEKDAEIDALQSQLDALREQVEAMRAALAGR